MENILTYLLKLIVCSGIFFGYYLLGLRNKRFHSYNRFYLLITSFLSVILPFIKLSMFDVKSDNAQLLAMMQTLYGSGSTANSSATTARYIDWIHVGLSVSLLITSVIVVLVLCRIIKIYRLKHLYPKQKINHIHFINTPLHNAPFSFMNNLFWRNDIQINDTIGEQIYRHEMAHIKQKHSLDKLYFQLLLAVFWMNPFYYFMQKELLLIHEFIADKQAISDEDGAAFAQMLLKTQFGKFEFEPAHSLFYSTIKKRLLMITNAHKTSYSYLRRLLVLPLLGCVTFAFAFRAHKIEVSKTEMQYSEMLPKAINPNKSKGPITKSDSTPKVKPTILLRTQDTTRMPLYVVDGVVKGTDKTTIKNINPNQIESITILKDKSATAIYGDKAKDGVVLIVTKKAPLSASNEKVVIGYPTNKESNNKLIFVKDVKLVHSNQDGDSIKFKIRGEGKIGSGKDSIRYRMISNGQPPLIYVNGNEVDYATLNAIKPETIESINVLKNKAAIKKYGEKGEKGVIIVTLKK